MIVACIVVGAVGMVLGFLLVVDAGMDHPGQRGGAIGLFCGALAFWILALGALWMGAFPK